VKFVLDHDVPEAIALTLLGGGNDVVRLRDILPQTTADRIAWNHAQRNASLFVTCNRNDFLTLAAEGHHQGLIIVVRRDTEAQKSLLFRRSLTLPVQKASLATSTSPSHPFDFLQKPAKLTPQFRCR